MLGPGVLAPRKPATLSGLPAYTSGLLEQNTPAHAETRTQVRELYQIPHHGHQSRWQDSRQGIRGHHVLGMAGTICRNSARTVPAYSARHAQNMMAADSLSTILPSALMPVMRNLVEFSDLSPSLCMSWCILFQKPARICWQSAKCCWFSGREHPGTEHCVDPIPPTWAVHSVRCCSFSHTVLSRGVTYIARSFHIRS